MSSSSLRHGFTAASRSVRPKFERTDRVTPDVDGALTSFRSQLEDVIHPMCPLCHEHSGAILHWGEDTTQPWEGCCKCLREKQWDRAQVGILVPVCCCQCGQPVRQEAPLMSINEHEWICSNCDSVGWHGRTWCTQWPPCCPSPEQFEHMLRLKAENERWLQNVVATDISYATGFIGNASALNRACLRDIGVQVSDGVNAFSVRESLRGVLREDQKERRVTMLIWGAPHPRNSDSSYVETEEWSRAKDNPQAILCGLATLMKQTTDTTSLLHGATCLVTSPTTPSYEEYLTGACLDSTSYSMHRLDNMDAEPLRYRPKSSDRTLSIEISPHVTGIIHPPLDRSRASISLSTLVRERAEHGLVVFLGEYDFTLSLTTLYQILDPMPGPRGGHIAA